MRNGLVTLAVASVALAAGCAAPIERRIADELTAAGVPPQLAQCMAGHWAQRLNVAQLRRLAATAEELAAVRNGPGLAGVLERSRALQDPEIVEVVTLSAARCSLNF